jgi:hypothetical protein
MLPPQCYNCQLYRHTRNNCCYEPKCVKCGSNHLTKTCSKDRHSPPKRALCTKEHTANFKGCPVYKATFKKTVPNVRPSKGSNSNDQSKTKHAEATKVQLSHSENNIADTISTFISNLNSLIGPLISLLITVLNILKSNSSIP